MDQLFTVEEVAAHSTPDDAWVIFQGNVYDITNFIPLHPGGAALNDYLGRDVEKVWIDGGFSKHLKLNNAYSILSGYKIGRLIEDFDEDNESSNFLTLFFTFVLFAIILGLTLFSLSAIVKIRY
jgi:cytochrome b involved in lipid metabolism